MTILPKHISVVDDDPSVRQSLERLIKSLGYEVTAFATADAFLRSSNFPATSCILLDVQMPGLSGLDLQKVIASLRSPIPIIFITAHREEELKMRALANGAQGYLEKPFDEQALITLIEKATAAAPLETQPESNSPK
jgi:FixJ family two-component response regulator